MFRPSKNQLYLTVCRKIHKLLNPQAIFIAVALLSTGVAGISGIGLNSTLLNVLETCSSIQTGELTDEPIPEVTTVSHYQVLRQDISWEQARELAEQSGGHLASITTPEEWEEVKILLDQTFQEQTGYVWLGAWCNEEEQFVWLTDEPFEFAGWYSGEPSGLDQDGTPERYLCAWNLGGNWSWNDQRNDILTAVPSLKGSIGMVIEYEVETNL